MKILQINTWYNEGSTGKIVADINNCLISNNIQSYVLYGRGLKAKNKNIIMCSSNIHSKLNSIFTYITGDIYGGIFNTFVWLHYIKKIKPDIVHIHCTNSFVVNTFKLLSYLGKEKIKVVITLHAEYLYTANCGHALSCDRWKTGCGKCPRLKEVTRINYYDRTHSNWIRMQKSLNQIELKNREIICVSDWLKERAKTSVFFHNDDIQTILNGIDTNIFYFKEINCFNKETYNILFCFPNFDASNDDIKGCGDFLLLANKLQNNKNIHFYLVGGNKKSLDFSKYKNITYIGYVSDQNELADLYSSANLTLLLSKKETFSLVTAESLCCGTPVVGFFAGAPEQIAIKDYSHFINRNIDEMAELILTMPFKNIDKKLISEKAKNKYSKNKMTECYLKTYKQILTKI